MFKTSQASDVGSIPIARSINLVDSVALPLLRLENGANWPEFWTQVGPNSIWPTGSCPVTAFTGTLAIITEKRRFRLNDSSNSRA